MNSTYIAWLNDARAMEMGLIQNIQAHIRLADGKHPKLKARLEQHLEETKRHAELVAEAIERHGGRISTMKGVMSTLAGGLGGAAAAVTGDDLMKASLQDFAGEHLEIASYTALIAAAEQLGETESVAAFESILAEEKAMAKWYEENIGPLARKYIAEDKS